MAPTQPNNYIQQGLEALNKKFDDFIAAMPSQYVTIRNHDLQIRAHEERIAENAKRLDALEASTEAWMKDVGKWSHEQHDLMRKEWTIEVKDVNSKLDSVETSVVNVEKSMGIMTTQQGFQTKVLLWVLGVFTTLTLGAIGVIITLFLTHIIHF